MEKRCGNCGEGFPCNPEGAKKSVRGTRWPSYATGRNDFRVGGCNDCWCNEFRLDEAQLARLGQQFEDCLCPACLTTLTRNGLNG